MKPTDEQQTNDDVSTAKNGVCPFTGEECIDEAPGYCVDGDCLKVK